MYENIKSKLLGKYHNSKLKANDQFINDIILVTVENQDNTVKETLDALRKLMEEHKESFANIEKREIEYKEKERELEIRFDRIATKEEQIYYFRFIGGKNGKADKFRHKRSGTVSRS